MKYIKPYFEEITENDFFNKIGLVAHNCYQVDNNANAEAFVKKLMGFKHYAMIEHYQFNFEVSKEIYTDIIFLNNEFIHAVNYENKFYISCSLRPLLENYKNCKQLYPLISVLDEKIKSLFEIEDLPLDKEVKLLSADDVNNLPTYLYDKFKYVTLKIITDRGVSHELVRHRVASYAQESTRYCNYSKSKFGNELTFIEPLDYQEHKDIYDQVFSFIEKEYINMTSNLKMKAEMARSILPNKLKTSIIITCNIEEYRHIFELRCALQAHPDMRQIMLPIRDYFIEKGYIEND